jgi:DNA-binding MarR family transcriptional regulator
VSRATKRGAAADVHWLSPQEAEAWQALALVAFQLAGPLDSQLQRDSELTLFEYLILSQLSMAPGRTLRMSELAVLAFGSLSRLSNVAKRLEQRGWLSREPDPDNGRYTRAVLTKAGWRVVQDAAPGHVEAVRHLVIEPLTEAQLRALTEIGKRLQKSIQDTTTRAPDL